MQIIREAETYDRGFYTGVTGYFDGRNLDSAVLIRFLEQQPDGTKVFKSGEASPSVAKPETNTKK